MAGLGTKLLVLIIFMEAMMYYAMIPVGLDPGDTSGQLFSSFGNETLLNSSQSSFANTNTTSGAGSTSTLIVGGTSGLNFISDGLAIIWGAPTRPMQFLQQAGAPEPYPFLFMLIFDLAFVAAIMSFLRGVQL